MALSVLERTEMRALFEAGGRNIDLAAQFGVTKNVIAGLAAREKWGWPTWDRAGAEDADAAHAGLGRQA